PEIRCRRVSPRRRLRSQSRSTTDKNVTFHALVTPFVRPDLLARHRRTARRRRPGGPLLPLRLLVGRGRLPRGVDVLHPVGLPHHVAPADRTAANRTDRRRPVLVAALPSPAPRRAGRPRAGHPL